MIRTGKGAATTGSRLGRREFLRAGGVYLGAMGTNLAGAHSRADHDGDGRSVIMLMLVGGPSQLETWDLKPDAPAEIRGPFRPISTSVPGLRVCEHLPLMASRMDRVALVRSLNHDAAPIHETGLQLLQTGRLFDRGAEYPHIGAAVSRLQGRRGQVPASLMIPGPIGNTGVDIPHGDGAAWLDESHAPYRYEGDPARESFNLRRAVRSPSDSRGDVVPSFLTGNSIRNAFDLSREPESIQDRYGRDAFGRSCLLARRLVESGVRVVTVNMFETVFNKVTWDCHGSSPFSTFDDYARELLPTLDRALSALVDDLSDRGKLGSTLVVATGEFGRTPRINPSGGRDHWPGVWSALLAGGGIHGGRVIGSSDASASSPHERPVSPQELLATIYHSLGIDSSIRLDRPDGESSALVEGASPILELF